VQKINLEDVIHDFVTKRSYKINEDTDIISKKNNEKTEKEIADMGLLKQDTLESYLDETFPSLSMNISLLTDKGTSCVSSKEYS
jgi:hypothetical protein